MTEIETANGRKMSNRRKIVIVITGAIVICCIALLSFGAGRFASTTPTPGIIKETVIIEITLPPLPTYTALPTCTPQPPLPTYTALPTYTPQPPLPTYTALPTCTPQPPLPTYTALPTYTPPPTCIPFPTDTQSSKPTNPPTPSLPTDTPFPTDTQPPKPTSTPTPPLPTDTPFPPDTQPPKPTKTPEPRPTNPPTPPRPTDIPFRPTPSPKGLIDPCHTHFTHAGPALPAALSSCPSPAALAPGRLWEYKAGSPSVTCIPTAASVISMGSLSKIGIG